MPVVWVELKIVKRSTLAASTLKSCNKPAGVAPVVDPIEFTVPITMSPRTTPDAASVPVLTFDPVVAWSISNTVPPVYAAVANVTAVSFGPLAPTWSVPVVAKPVLLIVVDSIVPIVFVPVEEVNPVPNVVIPFILAIVAVLIVAVLIVAELIVTVPIVEVPVDAVMLDPNVTAPSCNGIVAVLIVAVLIVAVPIVTVPVVAFTLELNVAAAVTPRLDDNVQAAVTAKLEDRVTAPVTARLDDNVVAPAAFNVPVDLTPVVESCNALEVLSPSVIVCSVPSIPPKPSVLRSCG